MENKRNYFMIFGIINFLIFAYDVENDRDFFTWIWLLTSALFFFAMFSCEIKNEKNGK